MWVKHTCQAKGHCIIAVSIHHGEGHRGCECVSPCVCVCYIQGHTCRSKQINSMYTSFKKAITKTTHCAPFMVQNKTVSEPRGIRPIPMEVAVHLAQLLRPCW